MRTTGPPRRWPCWILTTDRTLLTAGHRALKADTGIRLRNGRGAALPLFCLVPCVDTKATSTMAFLGRRTLFPLHHMHGLIVVDFYS